MRGRPLQLILFLLGFMLLLPASGKPKNAPEGTSIASVNVAAGTVTLLLRNHGTFQKHVYKINIGTTLTINGQPTTLAQLHKGQKVVSLTEGDEDDLVSLDVQG